jgi:hypothetical protein
VRKLILLPLISGALTLFSTGVHAEGLSSSKSHFVYRDTSGTTHAVTVIHRYWSVPMIHPFASIDPRLDKTLVRAASFAEERANAKSKAHCWQYVKEALVASGAVSSYPRTSYAYQAGEELEHNFGFKKLPIRDAFEAPVGAVCVFGHGNDGAGHVAIRTRDGFVSDYYTKNRCKYPFVAAFVKYSE